MNRTRIRRDFAAVMAPLLLLVTACDGGSGHGARPELGRPAPAYAAPALDGDTLALAELRGSAVLLNVWATWCVPCREEMPELQSLQDELGARGLRVIAVSIDQKHADADVRRFLAEHDVDFTVLRDPEARVSRVFRTVGVPETLLIDGDGVLRARWIGQVHAAQLRSAIEEILPSGTRAALR